MIVDVARPAPGKGEACHEVGAMLGRVGWPIVPVRLTPVERRRAGRRFP